MSIRVLRAHYGAHAQVADVTFAVQQIVDSHGAGTRGDVRFRVENHVLRGDPAPGVAKTLFVSYSVNGAPERTFIAGEGHECILSAPQGLDPSRLYQFHINDAAHGAPHNGILSCHRTAGGDARGGDSNYVHVNQADCGSTRWRLVPVGPNTYKIWLADPQHGVRGGILSCHASVGTDRRGGDSVYVHVNDGDCGSSSWTFHQVGHNVYEITLADPQHGAQAGWLTTHKSVPRDNRGHDSSYVHVNVAKHASTQWRVTAV